MECLGCRLANQKENVHVVYENDYVCCFLDHTPFNEGHILIVPKKHFHELEELDDITTSAVMNASIHLSKAIKKLFQPDGITICQNGGIFNELTHYHMHVVPRYKHQSFADFYQDAGDEIAETRVLAETKRKLLDAIKLLDI